MMRRVIYVILVGCVFLAPVNRVDVGTLQPVEIISIYNGNAGIVVETDTGDIGRGEDLQLALRDLKETASGVIYFDTAEFLLVENGLDASINEMRKILNSSVRVCNVSGRTDLKAAVQYLRAHGDFPQIKHWDMGEKLPLLSDK